MEYEHLKYKKLFLLMVEKNISLEDIARTIGTNKGSVKNKILGKTVWFLSEAVTIRNTYFKDYDIEYIFELR